MKVKINKLITAIMLGLLLFVGATAATADTALVEYVAPTERTDGTPLAPTEIAGFNVYDSDGIAVSEACPVGNEICLPSNARSFEVITASVLRQLFVTTVDTDGRESAYSQVAIVPATIAIPKPPTGLSVSVRP